MKILKFILSIPHNINVLLQGSKVYLVCISYLVITPLILYFKSNLLRLIGRNINIEFLIVMTFVYLLAMAIRSMMRKAVASSKSSIKL